MATPQRPAQNVEDVEPMETKPTQYNRQTTNFGYSMYREPRAGGQRVLVRRPSVDLAQLSRQRSRAIIDNFFRKSSPPPVLEGLSEDLLSKISDVELGKRDYWEAQQQAMKREELHAELKTKATRPHRRHKRRSHSHRRFSNRIQLAAVEDINETQEHSTSGVDEKLKQRFEITEKTTAAITTRNHITTYKEVERNKPKLVTNPFDAQFAEADRGACKTVSNQQHFQTQTKQVSISPEGLKKHQSSPRSDGNVSDASCHAQHVLDTVESKISDSHSLKVTRMTSVTEEGATGVTSTSSVEITNIQQDIVIHPQDNILHPQDNSNIGSSDTSETMQCSATPAAAADTPTSKTSSKLSTGSLHLELSYEQQGSASDASNFSNEEDDSDCEVKKKPNHPVADTPVEFDGPLPCRFHDIPFFSEVEKNLGHVPTFDEYFSYRLANISKDLESRYPDLDKCYQQLISSFQGALTYEVFQKAALKLQSRAEMMYDGLFMVVNFGRYLFQKFPEYASNFTTEWVDAYIIHEGGWDVVTDMYYQDQLTPSPMMTAELIGAGGVSEESLSNALSQDECNGGQQMDSTDGQRVPSIKVIKSNTSMTHHKKPANVSPPVWDISQTVCFPALNRSCSVEVLPCVPENDSEEQDSVQSSDVVNKDDNSEHVTDTTQTTPENHSSNGTRLTSHKSLDNNNDSPDGHVQRQSQGGSYHPIRRSHSAPNLTRILPVATPTSPAHNEDDINDEGPPPGQQERRRSSLQSLQDFNDVFISYIPYIAGATAPTVVAVHVALEIVKRISSS